MSHSTSPPDPSHTVLEARQLCRSFHGKTVVRNISLTLRRGTVTGFIGLNGAGKTTTLRMLCGTLAPDSGSVWIDGIGLHERPQEARSLIGFLPDTPPLYPGLYVDEYLHYCATLRRIPRADRRERIAQVKRQTGLEGYGEQRICALSRGYQQRIGIAQAIIHQPPLIVLDEPGSGLDPAEIQHIRAVIQMLGQGSAVLLSTHSFAEARAVCDQVVVIHKGRIALQSPLDDRLERAFFALTSDESP